MDHPTLLLSGSLSAKKPSRGRRPGTKRRRRSRETKRHRRRRETKRHRRRRGTKRRRRRRRRRPQKQGLILQLPEEILLLIFDVLDYTTAILLTRHIAGSGTSSTPPHSTRSNGNPPTSSMHKTLLRDSGVGLLVMGVFGFYYGENFCWTSGCAIEILGMRKI